MGQDLLVYSLRSSGLLAESLDPDAAVLHLSPVALEPDWTGFGKLEVALEELTVARRPRDPVRHRDDELVPILGLVVRQRGVRASETVIAALQLWAAQVDAAVGVGCGAELQLQDEVLGELTSCPDLLDLPAFRGRGHHEAAVDRAEAPVG